MWKHSRDQLFSTVFYDVLESEIHLTGTPVHDHESVGIQYYNSQRMIVDGGDYNPPHMDGGTLTILIREDDDGDGLEVADLESTEELGSDGVGREASFLRVPAAPNEVVVLAGTRLQRLLGRAKARACVHRVVGPGQKHSAEDRVSVGIFRACAPPPA
jgi:Isopenicillin N synthase and related dioxygenases